MDGSSSIGFRYESFRLVQRLTFFAICAALSWVGLGGSALGQLRTGRAERRLYQQTLQDSSVEPASYNSGEVISIVDDSAVVPAACVGCDSGCDSCAAMPMQGCGAQGCDTRGCDTCCGGYSDIAPACTATCPPGCGPLMALWYRLQVRAEVPIFWRRDQAPPILVTSAPAGTAAGVAGQIGQATTTTLLGGSTLDSDSTAGVRITLGTWLGRGKRYGLMFRYWNAGDQDNTFNFDSNGFPILARPFFNTSVTGSEAQDTQLISFPGESVGNIRVSTESSVEGLELTLRRLLYMDRFTRIDWLYGYQHVGINEGLIISSSTTVTANTPLQGTMIDVSDQFRTENDFNGVSYGIMSRRQWACWKMEAMFRLGMGNLRRKVMINGTTTTASGGTSVAAGQGLLARNTNNQPFVDDTFVVVPEVGINFAYRIRRGIDFSLGYNYLGVPKVAQAAQQIDSNLAVNLSDPLIGALDPQLNFSERTYGIHSLGLGLQVRY